MKHEPQKIAPGPKGHSGYKYRMACRDAATERAKLVLADLFREPLRRGHRIVTANLAEPYKTDTYDGGAKGMVYVTEPRRADGKRSLVPVPYTVAVAKLADKLAAWLTDEAMRVAEDKAESAREKAESVAREKTLLVAHEAIGRDPRDEYGDIERTYIHGIKIEGSFGEPFAVRAQFDSVTPEEVGLAVGLIAAGRIAELFRVLCGGAHKEARSA